jgi:phospholipase C
MRNNTACASGTFNGKLRSRENRAQGGIVPIKNVVVVMFENRSYDNVLGWLYKPTNPPPYQTAPPGQTNLAGLNGAETNPDPKHLGQTIAVANQTTPSQIDGQGPAYAPTAIPLIDPGEYFCDMAQQILGLPSIPESNPYLNYSPQNTPSLAQGYTLNYSMLSGITHPGTPVPDSNVRDVMNYLTPAQMPVTSFLAHNYAVCDQWFASAPTQTYPNRAFSLCAAPGIDSEGNFSLIDDAQYYLHQLLEVPSVLSQLDAVLGGTGQQGPFWKVYFHDYSIAVKTVPQVAEAAKSNKNRNISTFDNSDWSSGMPKQLKSATTTFVEDLAAGRLPPFSLIEPRYFDNYAPSRLPANSNHPGRGNYIGRLMGPSTPIDAITGEVLLMQVYNLLQASTAWERGEVLLIVTYDEAGGLFDHVAPPLTVPPGSKIPPASSESDPAAKYFQYNVLGGRVPAIVVSPLIAPGTTVRAETAFDHTSIVKTAWDIFGLSAGPSGASSLTQRDLAAPSLAPALTGVNATGPFSGTIVAGNGSLTFTHTHLFPERPAAQFVLASAGPSVPLTVSVSQPLGQNWLSAVSSGETSMIETIRVTVDTSGLAEGTYVGALIIEADAANSPLQVPVELTIKPIW